MNHLHVHSADFYFPSGQAAESIGYYDPKSNYLKLHRKSCLLDVCLYYRKNGYSPESDVTLDLDTSDLQSF